MKAILWASTTALALLGCKDKSSGSEAAPLEPDARSRHSAAVENDGRNDDGSAESASALPSLPEVELEQVVTGLAAPTNMATAPDGTLVVLDQAGKIHRLADGSFTLFGDLGERVLDLRPDYDERGLLGFAFHPDYPQTRRVYAWYSAPLRSSAPPDYDHTNVLASFAVSDQGRVLADSEQRLLVLDWPAPNHDGGTVMFGPDDMLYLSLGDGGKSADIGPNRPPMGNGQDWTTLMGSIVRIDPDGATDGKPYGIPPDNPFVGDHAGADEIWAYGLRNPYAFSFDPEDGTLFAGDVGQEHVEEVDIIERGKNYGWSIKEGTLCFNRQNPHALEATCPATGKHGEPLVDPVMQYMQPDSRVAARSEVHGISVIGGHVYRGETIPALHGAYVFGDWSRTMDRAEGVLLVGRQSPRGWVLERLPVAGITTPHIGRYVRGFGQDRDGEIYVLTSDVRGTTGDTGTVWKLVPGSAT